MKVVSIVDNELRLCSNLDEYSFGKTNYDSIVSQEGYLFDGKNFSVWNFEDVKSFTEEKNSEPIVYYCSKNPLSANAKTFLEFFDNNDEDFPKALQLVCEAITSAAKNGNKIPLNGAGGILVDLSAADTKVLFLPEDLFKNSVAGLSKEEYMLQNGGWINESLTGLPALCFQRAAIIYKALTGTFPFPATDTVERNADILDRKFLPLELNIEGIDQDFAVKINKALKLTSNAFIIPGKKQKGKASEDLTPTPDFPLEKLEEVYNFAKIHKNDCSSQDFKEKAENYLKMQQSKINAKRNFRRNYATIFSVAAVLVVVGFITANTIKTRLTEYTSRGLNSVQMIQSFMYGVNKKDTTLLSNLIKGRNPQKFVDGIGQVYVIDKQRKTYDRDNGFAYPENWLFFATTEDKYKRSGIYGITNLKIDGKPVELNVQIYQKNEKPEPVTMEGNITLDEGSESVHKVEYFLIHSEGEDNAFIVEAATDVFTLMYKKGQWYISDIITDSTVLPVRSSTFRSDYLAQISENNGDVIQTVKNLKKKYPWLPTDEAMTAEKQRIEYAVAHPFEDLGF